MLHRFKGLGNQTALCCLKGWARLAGRPVSGPSLNRPEQPHVLMRLAYRMNLTLERYFPEQRLFLKSDTTTRFIRLRPVTQAAGITVVAVAVLWTAFATAVLMMDFVSSGSSRDQIQRQTALYEDRLNTLSSDRDLARGRGCGRSGSVQPCPGTGFRHAGTTVGFRRCTARVGNRD